MSNGSGTAHTSAPEGAVRNWAERMRSLTDCRDVASLSTAVRELCSDFGSVKRIDVLTIAETERRRALCFLRMESEAQEQRLMATLSAARFGDDVLLVVDLPSGSPTRLF